MIARDELLALVANGATRITLKGGGQYVIPTTEHILSLPGSTTAFLGADDVKLFIEFDQIVSAENVRLDDIELAD